MPTGLPADWPILFRHVMRTPEEVAVVLNIEEREGPSVPPPPGVEEVPPRRSVTSAPTRSIPSEDGSWSTQSGHSTRTQPRNTLRCFPRLSKSFTDGAKPKRKMAPPRVADTSPSPYLTT